MEESTYEVLRMFMGLDVKRSVKKKTLQDVLIKRGVSPYGTIDVVEALLFQIGCAADNRISEIDNQIEKDTYRDWVILEYTKEENDDEQRVGEEVV